MQKSPIPFLAVVASAASFAFCGTLAAQQTIAANSGAALLPDAPVARFTSGSSSSSQATQQQSGPPPQASQPKPVDTRSESQKALDIEKHQRMLGVIPNYNTVMNGSAPPLSAGQKYDLFFKGSVDPFEFAAAGADALLEQAEGSYPEYGGGIKGYSKRFGASFADGFIGNFFGNAVLPAAFHQDPRYFRMGHGTFKQRFWYSVSTTVRCKGDDGHWQFNYSNLAGNFIGGGFSNLYYPASDRGFALTLESGLTVTAEGTLGALAVEFYPDVVQYFRTRHAHKAAEHDGSAAAE